MKIMGLFLSKAFRRLATELRQERERADRLEIALSRQNLRLDELRVDLERLSDRLCVMAGREGGKLGGRPRKAAPQQQLDLAAMDPPARKAALREMIVQGTLTHRKEN